MALENSIYVEYRVCVCMYIYIHIFVLNTEFLSAKIYSVTFPLEAHLMLPVFTG